MAQAMAQVTVQSTVQSTVQRATRMAAGDADDRRTRAFRLCGRRAAWAALAVALAASFFPLRFSATSRLVFDVGTQPPAAIVRGIGDLLRARDMAQDALARLPAADMARLAAMAVALPNDPRPLSGRAAAALMDNLAIAPERGGRGLALSVAAPTPALAARAADAYVAAFLALDQSLRADPAMAEMAHLPAMRHGAAAGISLLPDPPGALALGLLGAAGVILLLVRRRWDEAPVEEGRIDHAVLPRELAGDHRVTWLGSGGEEGLDLDTAVTRLAAVIPPGDGCGRLLVVTGDTDDAATCATALARRLSDDRRVVLVALAPGATADGDGLSGGGPGLGELVRGTAGFGAAIRRDPGSWAHVIPAGATPADDPDTAADLSGVLDALRRTYDVVVASAPRGALPSGTALSALDPIVTCVSHVSGPSTAAVETLDRLSAMHFPRIVMLRLDEPAPVPAVDDAPPSLDAVAAPRRPHRRAPEPPLLAGAA